MSERDERAPNLAESAPGRRSDGKLPNTWHGMVAWYAKAILHVHVDLDLLTVGRYGGLALICIVLHLMNWSTVARSSC